MKYILDGNTVTVTPPAGLYFNITDVDTTLGGSVDFTDSLGTITIPGTTPLPLTYCEEFTIAATGKVTITVAKVGNQDSSALFDSNGSAGHYPGKWGTGIGSGRP